MSDHSPAVAAASPADAAVDDMVSVNERQRAFYETAGENLNAGTNAAGRIWGGLRRRTKRFRHKLGLKPYVRELHYRWLGDLSGLRVLDLGCYDGNSVSLDLASRAGFYLGVDLSEKAIARLQTKLEQRGLTHARGEAIDFLSKDFAHEPFDVIYANSVLHHFRDFEAFLSVLHERLKPGGRVVSYDPLQTSWLSWSVRTLYRPFQADADWEWPFTQRTFRQLAQRFDIEAVQGTLGYAKWALPLVVLPLGDKLALKIAGPLDRIDRRCSQKLGRGLWRCLNVSLLLRRRG